jgi:hypothetical protein
MPTPDWAITTSAVRLFTPWLVHAVDGIEAGGLRDDGRHEAVDRDASHMTLSGRSAEHGEEVGNLSFGNRVGNVRLFEVLVVRQRLETLDGVEGGARL